MDDSYQLPPELLEKLAPLLAKLEGKVRSENNVTERSTTGTVDAAALTNALNTSTAYHGLVNNIPKAGTLDDYHEKLRATATNIMNLVFPGRDDGDPLKSAAILAISTSFLAQLAESDPELYQFILIVTEGQWDGQLEHISRIIAAVSYILLFLNYRSGGQRLWLQGEQHA